MWPSAWNSPLIKDWKENKKTAYNEMVKSSFEGHLRTNYKAVTKAYGLNETQGKIGSTFERLYQIWKNYVVLWPGRNKNPNLAQWPDWLTDRLTVGLPTGVELVDSFFDMFRSVFSNIFSRKIPQFGTVNEKISYADLEAPTIANILAMNSFAHHDLITLPMGINQTITTETLDAVEDLSSRIPVLGGLMNTVIQGFHNLVFGKSPSGFKKGGVDYRLNFYGDMMVGIMSAEMYLFFTGLRKSNNDVEAKGIIPLNAFQEQGDDNLSQVVSARANSTVLNFKLTDIAEMGVYDDKDGEPTQGGYRKEIVSTVMIGQKPHFDLNDCPGTPQYPKYNYNWKKTDVILVDKNFNTLLDPRDEEIIFRFGFDSDNRRLFVINQIVIQAIMEGDIILTGFAQDPTVYGYEQVAIWEGRFRSYGSVKKSTRAWTTTIQFGQPKIYDENGDDYVYEFPRTILADIQKRPNLPPMNPGEPNYVPYHLGVYFTSYSTDNFNKWEPHNEESGKYFFTFARVANSARKGEFLKYDPKYKLPDLKYSSAFYDRDWEVDYLPMFKTVGDPNTEGGEIKLFSGIVAYRNKPYKGANMRVELYHHPYEHMAGDA